MNENELEIYFKKLDGLKTEISKIIVGQERVINEILIVLLAGGHAILEGVPGLAKTLMIQAIAKAVNMDFKRIQFTPDLMPSDILGTEILEENTHSGKREFKFIKGPVFANIILADEINRTAPKTQSALLEVMQEHKVTYAGKDYLLEEPFFLLATQNPIEQSGTFPLPEAQLDRFLMFIELNYPDEKEEFEILKQTTKTMNSQLSFKMDKNDFIKLQAIVRDIHIDDELIHFTNRIIRLSRPELSSSEEIKKWLKWGAGPRAGQAIILAAKANALLNKRLAVILEDIENVVYPVLTHRIILNYQAEIEKKNKKDICNYLIDIAKK
jgi:MoxR-like ATPase